MPGQLSNLANVHLDAVEHGDGIAFMHAVQEGAASRSYGLQVAALAGVPKSVIQRARQKLHELEQSSTPERSGIVHAADTAPGHVTAPLVAPEHPAVSLLQDLEPDSLTPRQALEALYRLRQLI